MDTALNPNNYPTYHIGDKVTIRQWDDMESEFGLNEFGDIKVPKAFTESMKNIVGKHSLLFMYAAMHLNFLILIFSTIVPWFFFPMFEQSCPTVVCASTLSFDDLLKGATAQLANPQA